VRSHPLKEIMLTLLVALLLVSWMGTSARGQTFVNDWNQQGVPTNLVGRVPVSSTLLATTNQVLPESRDLRLTHPEFIASDEQVRLRLVQDANITVTFVHEGAGYRNTVGCFLYADGSPPQNRSEVQHEVLFPNASYVGSGGGLRTGDTVALGTVPAGTNVGFWVRANAWQPGSATINPNGDEFSTISGLNAEPTSELRSHTVLLWEEAGQQLVLGFEDLLRTSSYCDHDFNDVVFLVTVDPPEAVVLASLRDLPGEEDTDGDGVIDQQDAYPDDAERAFVQYTPTVTGRETAAWEDQWPSRGDYDFNDLVVEYRFGEVLDVQGNIKETTALVEPLARGAAQHNGLALHLPVPASQIELVETTYDDEPAAGVPPLVSDGQSSIVTLFEDAHHRLPTPAGASFANTEPGTPTVQGTLVEVRVVFTQAVPRQVLGLPPYDLFLFRTNEPQMEVHFLDYPPTFRADPEIIGTGHDTGSPVTGQYYRDNLGFPWAMILPADWRHPVERVEMSRAYTAFPQWVESAGGAAGAWTNAPDLKWVW
jgi:LruC domain-containing protein